MHEAAESGAWYLGGSGAGQIPITKMTILSGGKKNSNNLDFRNFMIAPIEPLSVTEALRMCTDVYQTMRNVLQSLGRSTQIGDGGGFMPNLASNEEALAVIIGAIQKTGYKPGAEIGLIIDAAAAEFFAGDEYNFPGEGFIKTPMEMVEYYARLVEEYPILAIHGSMAKNDLEGWALFRERLSTKTQMRIQDIDIKL